MLISDIEKELKKIKKVHGDIQVTIMHTNNPEDGINVFETTVETVTVDEKETEHFKKRVRLWL